MKANTIKQGGHRGLVAILVAVLAVAALAGLLIGYEKLAELYNEQCVIVDMNEQVEITSGKMVKPDVMTSSPRTLASGRGRTSRR